MPIDFDVEPEFQEQIDWVEKFAKEEIEPLDNFMRGGRTKSGDPIDRDGWRAIRAYMDSLKQQVKDRGLWGFHLGKDLGGPGLGQVKLCLLNEKLGRTRSGPGIFGCQAPDTGNMELIAHNGTEAQKKKYMEPLLSGEKHSAYSMTEPHASEPGEFKCAAVRDGDEWIISWEKYWNTGLHHATHDYIFARTSGSPGEGQGITCFIVPVDSPGFSVEEFMWTFNMPTDHAHVRLTDVRVHNDDILGEEGRGLQTAQLFVHENRIRQAASSVGAGLHCIDVAVDYVNNRTTFGKPLSQNQAIQFPLAELYTEAEMIRALIWKTAWEMDQGIDHMEITDRVAMCNYRGNRFCCDAADRAMQSCGGVGYGRSMPFEHIYRHHRRYRITEGAEEIQIRKVAGKLFGYSGRAKG